MSLFPYSMLYLEKVMATHFSTLAWKIPWMEEPGSLQSMGSLRVRHDWATSLSCIGEGNGNPLQCSCLENPRDGGAWWAAVSGVAQSWTQLKWLSSSMLCFSKKKKKSLYTDNRWKIALKTTTNYKDAWDYIWVLLNPTNPLPQQGLFIQIISVPNKIEDPPQYPHLKASSGG